MSILRATVNVIKSLANSAPVTEDNAKAVFEIYAKLAEKAANNLDIAKSLAKATNGVIHICKGVLDVGYGFKEGFEAMTKEGDQLVKDQPDLFKRATVNSQPAC